MLGNERKEGMKNKRTTKKQSVGTTEKSSSGKGDRSPHGKVFEPCGVAHPFCTEGAGVCKLREGHEDWGAKHCCNLCGKEY